MNAASVDHSGGNSDPVSEFAALWQQGESRPDLATFIERHEDLTSRERADLVLIDQYHRWRGGCGVLAEEYLPRLPDVAADDELKEEIIVEEFRSRGACGDSVIAAEVLDRFPELRESLAAKLAEPCVQGQRRAEFLATRTVGTPSTNRGLLETTDFEPGDREVKRPAPLPEKIGKFRIKSVLGCGGFGTVYSAFDEDLRRHVAVKVPHSRLLESAKDREFFFVEARTLAALDHPAIVPVFEVSPPEDELCYVVAKLIEGRTLEKEIQSGRLSHEDSAAMMATLADALNYAHGKGFVHRDVKPANILVDAESRPYITDLGLAQRDNTMTGSRQPGTPAYMSPEQARRESHLVDGRSDIYSLGAVFYKMLTGREPFFSDNLTQLLTLIRSADPPPPREFEPTVPKELERICLKALNKRASERFSDGNEMAADLRDWLGARNQQPDSTPSDEADSADREVRVVPKGLHSFDGSDADFFLRLLPGPYDRDGLPESIRFWKTRIEETDPDQTFRVGLAYGPSGCGKSSMVKAGLLPLLPEQVTAAYVEATRDETGQRLLRSLHKRFSTLPRQCGLVESMSKLRAGKCLPRGKKLLIVIDQFEQWLHATQQYADAELVAALRQCDGEHVQALLLVRDDFWMAITRLMRELEIPLVERRNSAPVDLFSLAHAHKVLGEFGKAYERLPDRLADMGDDQARFLSEAVDGLARNGRTIPVRLSLFAEMVKAKPWTPKTLEKVGGAEGVGLTFLEETFGAAHAPPVHRLHQTAIRAVLTLLLPEPGSGLKGSMRSAGELLAASGYENQREDFHAVVDILNESHLITPTDPEGAAFDDAQRDFHAEGGEKYYQLAHEYLIPSLREWLTRKRRETRRGRAELLLEERTQQWSPRRPNRLLPSLGETLRICGNTSKSDRTQPQRDMLRQALLVHGRRLGLRTLLVAGLAVVAAILILAFIPKQPGQIELLNTFSNNDAERSERIEALDKLRINDVHIFPRVVKALEKIDDSVVVRQALEHLSQLAGEQPAGADNGTEDSVRDPLIGLLLELLAHPSDDVQKEAFKFYARLAKPPAVIETIRRWAGEEDSQLAAVMVRYVDQLELRELEDETRSDVLRDLAAMISDERHSGLVAAAVGQLDGIPPAKLLNWLMQSHDPWDAKSAAKESLAPYARKTNAARRHEIGRYVEQQLTQQVETVSDELATTFELEYLIQSAGQIAALREQRYDNALGAVAQLISNRDSLPETDSLDTAVEAFALLNHDKRVSLDPVRALLADDDATWPNREAAAVAVGDLLDMDSLEPLISLTSDTELFLNLRWRAMQSLRKLGRSLHRERPDSPELDDIVALFHRLLEDNSKEPMNVVREALTGYGELGDATGAPAIFPLLAQSRFTVDGIVAVLTLLTRHPTHSGEVVRAYLPWRTQVGRLSPVPENPDQALLGFSIYLKSADESSQAARSVAAALAGAQAEMPDETTRSYAGELLKDLLEAEDAPQIDPKADAGARAAQLQEWLKWWEAARDEFRLKAAQLVRDSPSR